MSGRLGVFVNGNMFMGLFGSDVGVELAPDDSRPQQTLEWLRCHGRSLTSVNS